MPKVQPIFVWPAMDDVNQYLSFYIQTLQQRIGKKISGLGA